MSEEMSLGYEIGCRIKAKRKEKKWTQTQLGNKAWVSHAYISHLERGQISSPSVMYLCDIAKALGVTPKWLIFGDGDGDNI